jgi:hypothetical protein
MPSDSFDEHGVGRLQKRCLQRVGDILLHQLHDAPCCPVIYSWRISCFDLQGKRDRSEKMHNRSLIGTIHSVMVSTSSWPRKKWRGVLKRDARDSTQLNILTVIWKDQDHYHSSIILTILLINWKHQETQHHANYTNNI